MWCDAGAVRDQFTQKCIRIMTHGQRILADKMTVLQIDPFTADERAVYHTKSLANFQYNKNRIGGGILAGGVEAWRTWDKHYREMIAEMVKNGLFVGKDQNVFANMALRWPRDVHVVVPSADAPRFDWWFYMLYYFSCPLGDFAKIV